MPDETLRISKSYWWLYLISVMSGIAVWLTISFFTGEREAWDSRYYFTYGLPLMVLLAGVLGFVVPNRPWRWAVTVMASQALVAILQNPTANLLPLGLLVFVVLSIPLLISAYLGGVLRRRLGR